MFNPMISNFPMSTLKITLWIYSLKTSIHNNSRGYTDSLAYDNLQDVHARRSVFVVRRSVECDIVNTADIIGTQLMWISNVSDHVTLPQSVYH